MISRQIWRLLQSMGFVASRKKAIENNMGYDVYITRKDNWLDGKGEEISLNDWIQYLSNDEEMRQDNYAEAETPQGVLRIESEGLSVWLGYSGHGRQGNMAWFNYFEGNIVVKNSDEEIRKKMYVIAQALNAKVQGEEGELYGADGQSNLEAILAQSSRKQWWQFWKTPI